MTVVDRWKFAGFGIIAPAALLGLAVSTDALAHVCNKPFAVLPAEEYVCEDETYPGPTVSRDGTLTYVQEFKQDGWIKGTNPQLGNSHELGGGEAVLFTFHLDSRSRVTITFAPGRGGDGSGNATFSGDRIPTDTLKPAFTLYRGLLPEDSHDDSSFDPLNPVDEVAFAPAVSPIDAAPGDPAIPAFLLDPDTGIYSPNPEFTDDVAEWYDDHYRQHRGYRDTMNFTLTGGRGADGNPINLYAGQFDALGDWSLANEDAQPGDELTEDGNATVNGNWSKLRYITHAKSTGRPKHGRFNPAVVSNILLQPGDYTIAADGANCNDDTPECVGPFVGGKLSFKAVRFRHR